MYQKILNAQLTFPSSMSEEARSLLEGLLTRDPEKRLAGDAVRKHPFFKGLDWDALNKKEIDPSWKPPVKDDKDTTQIDDYFTNEKPADSPGEGHVAGRLDTPCSCLTFVVPFSGGLLDDLDEADKDIFEGFTFQGTNLRCCSKIEPNCSLQVKTCWTLAATRLTRRLRLHWVISSYFNIVDLTYLICNINGLISRPAGTGTRLLLPAT